MTFLYGTCNKNLHFPLKIKTKVYLTKIAQYIGFGRLFIFNPTVFLPVYIEV